MLTSHTFTIRGGSRKKIAKKIIPKVPTNSRVRKLLKELYMHFKLHKAHIK